MTEELMKHLKTGLELTNISLDAQQQERLLGYLALLIKWNKTYNLVGKASETVLLNRHCLDSLAVLKALRGQPGKRLLDVGSGAGLPGIPLAIAQPNLDVVLCEPREKRVLFLETVVNQLGLNNVTVERTRIESLQPQQGFDFITCRAFSSLANFIELSQHCLAEGGYFVAMKGSNVDTELGALPANMQIKDTLKYTLPDTPGEWRLLIISPT